MSANAQTDRFDMLQRVHAIYDAMDGAANMKPVMDARLTRTIAFRNNAEAWIEL